MKQDLSLLSILSIYLLLFSSNALAEEVVICPYKNLSLPSGTYTFCSFKAKPGEQIFTEVSYHGGSNGVALGKHSASFWHSGSLTNGGWLGGTKTLSLGQYYYFKRDVTPLQAGSTWVRYSITGATATYPDKVGLEVWADRSNLKAIPLNFELDGKLQTPFEITTVTPFRKGDILVSLSVKAMPGGVEILRFPIERGIGLSEVTVTNTQLFSKRTPIPRGTSELVVTVNPEQVFAEYIMDDNVAITKIGGTTLFLEKIPDIMGAIPNSWTLGRDFLNTWIDNRAKKKNQTISSIDWGLDIRHRPNTSWLLDRNNAADSRIVDVFNNFIQPNNKGFLTQKGIIELTKQVREKFIASPSTNTVNLATKYGLGITEKDYHKQHFNTVMAQDGGWYASGYVLDAVTAAFGGFSFYVVPFGTATKEVRTVNGVQVVEYLIKIKEIAVHVVDSFDFNGEQWLGCFKSPNVASAYPISGGTCALNSFFRVYQAQIARGSDYNIFTIPHAITFPQPVAFRVS